MPQRAFGFGCHACITARLVNNLVSLETMLRIALYLMDTPREQRLPPESFSLARLKPGDVLRESWLTSWHKLSELIDAYNSKQRASGGSVVDPDIVNLRDAIAHGRLIAEGWTTPLTLVRFCKPGKPGTPAAGQVTVEKSDLLDLAWFSEQIARIGQAGTSVAARIQQLR